VTVLERALPAPFEWCRRESLVWIEAPLPGGRAAFSTRLGGFSAGAYSSLNLGILTEDDPELVPRNRKTLTAALGRESDSVAMGWQVHGSAVQRHHRAPAQPQSLAHPRIR
jgi:hypothetical protein